MGARKASGNVSPLIRWNQIRSAVSKEIRKPEAVKLQTGQYNQIVKQLYHSTKDIPINKVIGSLGQRLSELAQPNHPFTDPIPYYHIDHDLTNTDLVIPGYVWIDATTINGSSYYARDYQTEGGYGFFFQPFVRSVDSWFNRINDSGDERMPHLFLTQPSWNPNEKRWESVWIITDKSGSAIEGFEWNPEEEALENVPEPTEEEIEPEPEPKKPEPTPTPSPEIDKAKAREITSSDLQKRLTYLKKQKKEQEKDYKLYKELGDPELLAEVKKSLLETIKSITAITKELAKA